MRKRDQSAVKRLSNYIVEALEPRLLLTTVTTGPVSAVSDTSATVTATINPQGSTSAVEFQYSTSPNFAPTVETTLGSGFSGTPGVAADASGDVFVVASSNTAVEEIQANGTIKTIGSGFDDITGVAVDASGDVFVTDNTNFAPPGTNFTWAVQEISANGTIGTLFPEFLYLSGVAVNAADNIFVTDSANNTVAVDASGDIFVADSRNNAVKEILPNGIVQTVGSGFSDPTGVAVDAFGDLFVADSGNNAIKEILPNGTILTVGSGGAAWQWTHSVTSLPAQQSGRSRPLPPRPLR
jgi:hypothetical protein